MTSLGEHFCGIGMRKVAARALVLAASYHTSSETEEISERVADIGYEVIEVLDFDFVNSKASTMKVVFVAISIIFPYKERT